jgi:hypothetical protein
MLPDLSAMRLIGEHENQQRVRPMANYLTLGLGLMRISPRIDTNKH